MSCTCPPSLRKVHPPEQVVEARVTAHRVVKGVAADVRQVGVARLVSSFQPLEYSVVLAGAQMEASDFLVGAPRQPRRKHVAAAAHGASISPFGISESQGLVEFLIASAPCAHPFQILDVLVPLFLVERK